MSLVGNVLITGGAGYLGRGIMRRAQQEDWPCHFIVYSRDETKQALCKEKFPDAVYILGDVTDGVRLNQVMNMAHPTTIIHTAAIKYVPEAEYNVNQCIDVNVIGTCAVLSIAAECNVDEIIVISTDKACRPVNTYGASKMLAERMTAEFAKFYPRQKFVCTRYGNVVGSTGSFIPMIAARAKAGASIRMTDGNMTRFWMSIDEAVDCILEARDADTGTITIPKCRAMRLEDVIRAVAPNSPIECVGVRPGEKTNEELVSQYESQRIRDGGKFYYQLYPVGSAESTLPRFSYTSDAPHEWMTKEQLVAAYEESLCI